MSGQGVRGGRPRSETQAETRQHLLDAAARLFEERGFHGTSVAEIAKSAGYTTGAIYANFMRKEDLAVAVLTRSIERSDAALARALAVRGDLAARLIRVIRWRNASIAAKDIFATLRLELWLLASRDAQLRTDLIATQRTVEEGFARLLDEQAADLGVVYRVDTKLLAGALLAGGDGANLAHHLDPAGNHQRAFAWALASLMVNSMEPRPITPADWPAFVETLLRAADDEAFRHHGAAADGGLFPR